LEYSLRVAVVPEKYKRLKQIPPIGIKQQLISGKERPLFLVMAATPQQPAALGLSKIMRRKPLKNPLRPQPGAGFAN
jgi:hypothetical protein